MGLAPYLIDGNVRRGPLQDYTEINSTIDTGVGAETINLTLSSGTDVGSSLTVTLRNNNTGESITTTTDANGDYLLDAANLVSGYSNSDSIRVSVIDVDRSARLNVSDQRESADPERDRKTFQSTADAGRSLPTDRRGNEYRDIYPLPVTDTNDYIGDQNPSWTATYSGGLIATETITIRGVQYRKTYTWSGGNLTEETAWTRV